MKRHGLMATGERLLSNKWVGMLAFSLLLTSLHLTIWQGFLVMVVYIQHTTKPPAWLLEEIARAALEPSDKGVGR